MQKKYLTLANVTLMVGSVNSTHYQDPQPGVGGAIQVQEQSCPYFDILFSLLPLFSSIIGSTLPPQKQTFWSACPYHSAQGHIPPRAIGDQMWEVNEDEMLFLHF